MTPEDFRIRAAIALYTVYVCGPDRCLRPEHAATIAVEEARILVDTFNAEAKAYRPPPPTPPPPLHRCINCGAVGSDHSYGIDWSGPCSGGRQHLVAT